jgi:hypothetical protein
MVLILDNAKYHHAREDWVTPSQINKIELGVFLRRVGVTQITNDEGRVFPASKFTADASASGGWFDFCCSEEGCEWLDQVPCGHQYDPWYSRR